ncbi:complex I assembly factor ACAD9, mitochondrial-like [Neocloeon triangulifer]|uniref:complex I assembly factor ACAD9, mitochondrial-like n=1 Tax=Neocloeon triangulifer TaxID=2078957 RepID=UPI00286EE0EC|nr:complex I assembly factor ACAD9, mitochondrial-like [Neocloeon triangulifer]
MQCATRRVIFARPTAIWTRLASMEVAKPRTTETVLAEKYAQKKKQEKPFAKELFLGRVDNDLFTFPEVLEPERLQTLNEMLVPIEKFFTEKLDSKSIDQNAKIPPEVLTTLKDMGLFGQQIPEEYGGLGLNATEFARIAEITALDGAVAVTLAAHQSIGLKGLLICGTDEQKQKYLPRLATGEWVAAFCLTEPSSGSDAASIQTRATLAEDGKTWKLNGGKIWISNGGIADFFTVFAKTEVHNEIGEKEDKVTAFIVERGFGGITSGKPEDKLGIRGSNTTEVHFDNTPIPAENVLGEVGGGFKVAMNILNSGRFSMGSSSAGVLKKLIKLVSQHATERKQFGKQLKEFGLIKEKVANLTLDVYAMESMAYMTAGMLDMYENPDCSMEAAMVKVYSSEAAWSGVSECLQILGGLGYMKDYPYEQYLRDSRIMMIFEGTNEILRLFISLLGFQYAGVELKETVRRVRNPLFNPLFMLKFTGKMIRHRMDNPKLKLRLKDFVHPSLDIAANQLEYCVLRLQYAVQVVLQTHGKDVVDAQLDLKRIADMSINVYAAFSSLSRASRAYCIGLHNAEYELTLANTIVMRTLTLVKKNVNDLENGPFVNFDQALLDIGRKVFEKGGYYAAHPLTKNFV